MVDRLWSLIQYVAPKQPTNWTKQQRRIEVPRTPPLRFVVYFFFLPLRNHLVRPLLFVLFQQLRSFGLSPQMLLTVSFPLKATAQHAADSPALVCGVLNQPEPVETLSQTRAWIHLWVVCVSWFSLTGAALTSQGCLCPAFNLTCQEAKWIAKLSSTLWTNRNIQSQKEMCFWGGNCL